MKFAQPTSIENTPVFCSLILDGIQKSSKSPIPLTFSSVKNMKMPRKFPTKFGRWCKFLHIDWCIMFQFLLHSVSYTPVYTINVYRKITHTNPYAVMRLVTRLEIKTLVPVSNIYPFSFVYHRQYFATCFVISLCVYHTGRLCDWQSVS